ncbi:hypothetical protein F5X99DRAFT_204008 [Biscogniauxia marginata]|nr:hypothetical protein F5X99DRAFT_204008 [Biscogniauxia marginata]
MDKEATEALPATQLEIDKHRFRLRGIRTQQLPGHQTKTTQYRVVWGEHPNRSDSWVNEDDIQILMPRLPCERFFQNSVPQVGRDVMQVHRMRCSRRSKGKKIFEYLVDELSTWITEDQLRISLSPMLFAELKASSPDTLSPAQSKVHPKHPATPINDENCHPSRTPRSPATTSTPPGPARSGNPDTGKRGGKRGHQDLHTETSSETHHSVNTDDSHNACDTGDEDPQPAKRRKRRAAPAATPTTCRRHTPELHLGQPGPLVALSTAPEIDDAQPQADDRCPATFIDNSHHHASRTSRSPSTASEEVPIAEYQEWPFQGFLKRIKIGDDVTYNLECKLPRSRNTFTYRSTPQHWTSSTVEAKEEQGFMDRRRYKAGPDVERRPFVGIHLCCPP